MESFAKYNANLDISEFQKSQPVIGIVSTPLFYEFMRTDTFNYPHFTWETNLHFVHYAGSWAVPIRYDLSDEDLEKLLDSVNGVFFTGGATPLIDSETGEMSFFYKNAKKIWEYMKRQKDEKGIDFPIFGICQGFEIIHYLANEDHKNTLSNLIIYGQSRPMNLKMEAITARQDRGLFDDFPFGLITAMTTQPINYHAHDWVIHMDTYKERQPLRDFFDILATDTYEGDEFVVAVEAKKYPVSGVMFHPETQNRHIVGIADSSVEGKVNDETTD